jgi:diguanylate cyclase (GGDEF)-like protein
VALVGKIRISLRSTLGATILLMGALGMTLALTTGEIYRDLALDNQSRAFSALIGLKADDLLKELDARANDLGLALQSQPAFSAAHLARDSVGLSQLLDMQFHQYFVTAEIITLVKLRLLNVTLDRVIAQSTEGAANMPSDRMLCPTLIDRARRRTGSDRLHTLSGLCQFAGQPYEIILVPVGGLLPKGYLEIVTDPLHALTPIENALGMPMRLTVAGGAVAYQSRSWPEHAYQNTTLLAEYPLTSPEHTPILTIGVASDVTNLYHRLSDTRRQIIVVASLSTALVAMLVLMLLRASALKPLEALTRKLRSVQHDRSQLGEDVPLTGTSEISELTNDFNVMSSDLKDLYKALEHMAFTDSLTKLPNRTRFHERLHACTAPGQRRRAPFALLLMDLDRFKGVNDTLGHHIGDYLLQMVGLRLESVLRKSDALLRLDADNTQAFDRHLVARLGGDEFAAILDATESHQDAQAAAEKLLAVMQEPFIVEGHHFNIGMSIGIVRYPEDGTDMNVLMRRADVAMYSAKQAQRGYAFYDSDTDQHSLLKLTLEHDLRYALETDALALYYQPKFDIASGAICGAEALARWPHAQRGFIPPDQFIPVAELTGLIHPLTLWVLRQALEQCARWHREGFPIGVAVNLSALNFHDPAIADQVMTALRHADLAPHWLTLELTESTVMSDADDAARILTQLDAMGVRLSIDDFGTGYSSLSYLRKLPMDELKIDKSFVIDMKDNVNDTVIVSSTIDLAHNMGLKVVAEGVESTAVQQRLRALGCDIAQGYHLSHPLPEEQFFQLLQSTATGQKDTLTAQPTDTAAPTRSTTFLSGTR